MADHHLDGHQAGGSGWLGTEQERLAGSPGSGALPQGPCTCTAVLTFVGQAVPVFGGTAQHIHAAW